ncbi:prepilin peptidase [Rhodanobacter sp. DHG33]|uniref:A24 family peptidase n=1 Tax=Rhodanobacter sp. DHG33 TaxID=2775921 RepID=UPI0021044C9E|nr:prepilin peptidase [Rhodanobacter sp. DHG33]
MAAVLCILVIGNDLYVRRVPNIWLLSALCLGIALTAISWIQGMSGPPWPALLGFLIGLVALLPFHVFGWMGAGDVKFFALLGFLLGAKALLPIWIIGSLIAGVHSTLVLLSRHWLSQAIPAWEITQTRFSNSAFAQRMLAARQGRKGLPYAAWLGVGALIVIFDPALMHW